MDSTSGWTLAERSRRSGIGLVGAGTSPAEPGQRRAGEPAHCWVLDPAPGCDRSPGLVIEWRRDPSGWVARVAFVVPLEPSSALVFMWLPADRVRPAP